MSRLLDFYLATAARVYAIERPGDRLVDHLEATRRSGLTFKDRHEAQDWLYAEANALLACVQQCAGSATLRRSVDLLWAAKDLAESGANSKQYEAAALALRDAAEQSGDTRSQGRALTTLTNVHLVAGRFDQADEEARHAMQCARTAGDLAPSCWAANDRGIIALYQNRNAEGEAYLQQAIESFRLDENLAGEASALCNLSRIHLAMGHSASAVDLAQQGIAIYDRLGHTLRGANGRYALGLALTGRGELTLATARLTEALEVFRDSRQRLWEGMTLFRLAEAHLIDREPAASAALSEQALAVLRGIGGEWRRGNVLTVLGRALESLNQRGRARVCWQEALSIYELLGSPEASDVRDLLTPAAAA
jgi:tetratricopeptide (TPR) repeat protein